MIQKIPDPEPQPRPAEAAHQAETEALEAPEEGTTAEERGLAAALSEAERDGDESDPAGDDEGEGGEGEVEGESVEAAQADEAEPAPAEPLGDVTAVDGPGARDGLPLTRRVEAVLFAASGPMAPRRLATVLEVEVEAVKAALDALVERWAERDTSMELLAIAGGYRFMTRPVHAEDLAGLARKGPIASPSDGPTSRASAASPPVPCCACCSTVI